MRKVLSKIGENIKREIISHPKIYLFLTLTLALAFFVRVYRTEELLGFYFDQGRDALVIWRLWHEGRPFLIGPVTGLAGIFLGPLYYYIIAPFYLIGGGNPVVPAVFLATLATTALFFLYYLGWKIHKRRTGLIAVTIGAFSLNLVKASRWLANPTPILLTSILLLWAMWEITVQGQRSNVKGQKLRWLWMAIALLVGISLQFEAASAVFYLPMILIFAWWQKKKLPDTKTLFISLLLLFSTFLPQILFNFRHDNILFDNFKRVLFGERSFRISFWQVLGQRLNFFWSVFYSKIIPDWPKYVAFFSALVFLALLFKNKTEKTKKAIKLLLIFIITPMVGLIFFQGNFGNIYDYYLTGYYLPMILLFSLGLGIFWQSKIGKVIVVAFFIVFFLRNGSLLRYYLIAGVDGPNHISLGNELQAVNWVFEDLPADKQAQKGFNVDVYVPPVIPHVYDYLFLWQGTLRHAMGEPGCQRELCGLVTEEQVPLVYVMYEVDPPHPWRLENWLAKYKDNTEVLESEIFGGITIERRLRL